MSYKRRNVIAYLFVCWLVERDNNWLLRGWVKRIKENCFQDWVNWKTASTMEEVDKQVEEIKEEWKQEELQATLERAQEAFPEAEVSLHNDQGAVLIEHPPDGSKAQDLLGGAMEIKSPWRF